VIPEAERVKKIRDFIAVYGPITIAQEKDWDGRVLEWAVFTYKSMGVKMPLSMIIDAPKPKELEGYFRIYPNVGGFNKGTAQYKITATSAIPPAPGSKPAEAAATPAAPGAASKPGAAPAPAAAQAPGRRGRAAQPAAAPAGPGATPGRRAAGPQRAASAPAPTRGGARRPASR
jgi:hypothetical protein